MRKLLFGLVLICVFGTNVFAQTWGELGFSFSLFNSNHLLMSADKIQDNTVRGAGFMGMSADYWYPLGSDFYLETGLNISNHYLTKRYFPATLRPTEQTSNYVVSVPLGVRKDFLKYAFVDTGVLFDMSYNSGIGSYFGVGARATSEIGIGMYINPYVKAHSVIPFSSKNVNGQLVEVGFKIGITYSLDHVFTPRGRGF